MISPTRGFLRLGVACVGVGALAWVWGFLALQAPGSPWHVPGYPQTVERLAVHAVITGLLVLSLAPARKRQGLLTVTTAGAVLSLGAQAASAAWGLLGLQIQDARHGSAMVLIGRVVGGGLLLAALAISARQRLRDVD